MTEDPLHASWLQAISKTLGTVYAVGGAVRNTLMGLPVSDVDLCGAARPDQVLDGCKGTAVTARIRAARFGTVELHIDGHMAEYTTFRQDSYRGGHQPFTVRFADTVQEDAYRRDFSVNALYADLEAPEDIIDPTGGLQALEERVLRTVTTDPDQVMKDDGLRILRAARFQAELGFALAEDVVCSAQKYIDLLDEIAPERKRVELTRLLESDVKYPMLVRTVSPVSSGFETLVRMGAWQKLFCDLAPVDFTVLDNVPGLSAGGKLAMLYVEKTPDALTERMSLLRYAKRDIRDAADALGALQAMLSAQAEPSDALRFGLSAVRTAKTMLAALAVADGEYRSALTRAETMLLTIADKNLPVRLQNLAVGGDDLVALCRETGAPRDHIGGALSALWQDVVNGKTANEREALLVRARSHLIDSKNHG